MPLYSFDQYSSTITTFAFHPKRSLLLIGTADGTSHVYNLETGRPISTSIGLNESLSKVKFSADGRYLVTCGSKLQLWELNNQQPARLAASPLPLPLETLAADYQNCDLDFIQFSPNSKLLMATFGTEVLVWDLMNRQQISKLPVDSGMPVFSPNSELIATITAAYPGVVTVWDAKSGQAKHVLKGHVGEILALAFSPDSRKLVSAGGQLNTYALEDDFRLDWAARLWDLETGQLIEVLEKFQEHRALTDALFSADGKTIYTTSDGTGVIAWPRWEDLFEQAKKLIQRSPPALNESELREFNVIDPESLSSADALIAQAETLAQANQLTRAHALVNQASNLNPYLNLAALHDEITHSAAQTVYEQGQKLARTGDMQAAKDRFVEALSIYPALGIDPDTEIKKIMSITLVEEGNVLAKKLDVEAASIKYAEALKLDPSLGIEPKQEAERRAFDAITSKWDVEHPTMTFKELEVAVKIAKREQSDSFKVWNMFCWWGSLYGFAKQVAGVECEWAVDLASPESSVVNSRDSRGLARALTGDIAGAIEDFKFVVAANSIGNNDMRVGWIKRLQAGEDPADIFNAETLEKLKNE